MYYLRQRTRISGPFSEDQIKALLHRGRVARSDKVSTDRVVWQSIGEIAELVDRRQPLEVASAEPDATAVSPDTRLWHYTLGGTQQVTAIDTARLKGLIASGDISMEEMVWAEGFANWQTVASVPELAAASSGGGLPPGPDAADLPPVQGGGFDFLPGELPPVQRKKRNWF